MDRFEIRGAKPLGGTIRCAGSKNATLPIMAAALLPVGRTVIEGTPDLQDIRTMAMVLRVIGADVRIEPGSITIDSSHCNFWEAPYELVRKMRASFYVLGPLVARFGRARVSLPGGCALGPRPVDLHLKALKKLGCTIDIEGGYVVARCERLKGTRIDLDIPSVGATGNILMASVAADGVTEIVNAACEPEIVDLADALTRMGAIIDGAGTPRITVQGGLSPKPINHRVIPDRIETGTFMIAAAISGGDIVINGARPDHLTALMDKMTDAGVSIYTEKGSIRIDGRLRRVKAVDVVTEVYPGFPTDLQAPWTALMTLAEGSASINDTIYPGRFNHVPELIRLGADIRTQSSGILVCGVNRLTGASIMCSDIRAAAALVLAALAAEGDSTLLRVYHLDRGYEAMEVKLTALGADIRRVRE